MKIWHSAYRKIKAIETIFSNIQLFKNSINSHLSDLKYLKQFLKVKKNLSVRIKTNFDSLQF